MAAPDNVLPAEFRFVGVRDVPLNFQLGEWRAFSIRCRLMVLHCESTPAFEGLPPLTEASGYLLKGVQSPVDRNLMQPRRGWLGRVLREYPRHLVDLTTGYDAYLAKFSGKTRATLKRKLRKFEELSGGKIDWREYKSRNELALFFPLAARLSAKTYQERLLGAGLPDTPAFMAKAFEQAAQGALRAYLLFLEQEPVSYLYLPIEGDRAIYAYLGYDPDVAEHSPGTVLQLLVMQRLFDDPAVRVFDFTEGAGAHKQLFATHTRSCADVMIMRRTMSMMCLTAFHAAFTRTEDAISKSLERLGIKRRLKMLLRAVTRKRV